MIMPDHTGRSTGGIPIPIRDGEQMQSSRCALFTGSPADPCSHPNEGFGHEPDEQMLLCKRHLERFTSRSTSVPTNRTS